MEGPLVSDTTELLSGAGSASEDSPIGHPATDSADGARRSSGRSGGDLSKLRVSDLQGLAQQLGIPVTARMRKGDLVAAIQERQGAGRSTPAREDRSTTSRSQKSATRVAPAGAGAPRPLNQDAMEADTSIRSGIGDAATRSAGLGAAPTSASAGQAGIGEDRPAAAAVQQPARAAQTVGAEPGLETPGQGGSQDGRRGDRRRNGRRDDQGGNGRDQRRDGREPAAANRGQNAQNGQNAPGGNGRDDDEDGQGRRRGRDRFRNRNRRRGDRQGGEPETVIAEDDVLIPIAGILDVLETVSYTHLTLPTILLV